MTERPADPADAIRLDKWLWAARFFKTRQLAIEAINGGKVHVDGQRVKPSRVIRAGSRLEIHKESLRWEIEVLAINKQRRPAAEARVCPSDPLSRGGGRGIRIWSRPAASVAYTARKPPVCASPGTARPQEARISRRSLPRLRRELTHRGDTPPGGRACIGNAKPGVGAGCCWCRHTRQTTLEASRRRRRSLQACQPQEVGRGDWLASRFLHG